MERGRLRPGRGPSAGDVLILLGVVAAAAGFYLAASRLPLGVEAAILSVGNADSAVVRMRGGRCIVVGGGGQSHSLHGFPARVLLPFLLESGIRHVDAAILLGENAADVGALPALVRDVRVERVVALQDLEPTSSVSLLGSYALASGTEWLAGADGTVLQLGRDARAVVLEWRADKEAGRPGFARAAPAELRASALRVERGPDALILFHHLPRQLIEVVEADRRVVAKALLLPDQGKDEATCRRLVQASGAETVIFSVDEARGSGGSPVRLITWLHHRGIRVFRTDLDGAVILRSNGRGWGVTRGEG